VTTDGDWYHTWTTYLWAREEARRCGDRRIGTDHLLVGLLHDPGVVAVLDVSIDQGRQAMDSLDRRALESLGLTALPTAPPLATRRIPARPTLRAVLKDRLPITPAAKKILEQASRRTRDRRRVNAYDLLTSLLNLTRPDPAADLIVELNIDVAAIRARLPGA
jgi:hypothetical protein